MNCAQCGQAIDEQSQFCSRCGAPRVALGANGDEPSFDGIRVNDVLEGKWRLLRKIGEGGMGRVYLAHELALDRQVAVKLLGSAFLGDAEVVGRFEREAKFTASLEHPNIVPVFAVGRVGPRPFMVMKKLEGDTLAGLLRQKGALGIDDALALMRQLCSGLGFIHSKGYVHRDIKAGNIFIGSDGHATLLDFGILRSLAAAPLTRAGVVMGTPQYMSPEQALGSSEIDHRADLYALAVVLFECLTGTLPFEADSELKLVQLQAHAPPPEVTERAPWLPQAVAAVVRRALAKRPEDRFGSVGELLEALEVACGVAPSAPVGSSTQPGQRKVLPESAAPVPLVNVVPAGGPVPLAQTHVVSKSSGASVDAISIELEGLRARSRAWVWTSLVLGAVLVVGGTIVYLERRRPVGSAVADGGFELAQLEPAAMAPSPAQLAPAGSGPELSLPALEAVSAAAGESNQAPLPQGIDSTQRRPAIAKKGAVGRLNVITTHGGEPYWAQIRIDGVARGRTPLEVELPVGSHRVHVERTGFRAQDHQIIVASGRQAVLRIRLRP